MQITLIIIVNVNTYTGAFPAVTRKMSTVKKVCALFSNVEEVVVEL